MPRPTLTCAHTSLTILVRLEVTIVLPYVVLRAEDTNQDLYAAVDNVSEK